MAGPLLQTKLYIPPAPLEWVPRPRLIERLNAGLGHKLTLISAPAGFGKTTLLSSWIAQKEIPVAWVSVDEGDNDPVRFLTYVIAALQAALETIEPGVGGSSTAMLQSPQPPPVETIWTVLINELVAIPQDVVLVLDDYHLVRAAAVHQQLAFLLEHLPPQMHLVITTREDPPLSLARWRARRQILEIRQADLVFTNQETAELMQGVMQLSLSQADVAALQRRTEGWAAGLQLAALSFRGHDDVHQLVQSFTGSHRYILDYLIEEVFERQTPDVQDFLIKTSILDRFTARLCDAVRFGLAQSPSSSDGTATVRVGSERVPDGNGPGEAVEGGRSYFTLLELEQSNLFIVPLDQSRQWYRYHHLFADLLRQRLRIVGQPGLASMLHRRASQWYEANGWPEEATHHALHAEDWERASALILDLDAALLKRGEVTTLLDWFRALPEEVVRANPRLCNAYSWPLILTNQIEAAESYLECAEQGVEGRNGKDRTLLGQVAVARVHIARSRGEGQRVIELAARALELLPQESLSERSITAMNLGIAQWHSGRLAEAEQALEEARRTAGGSENHYVLSTALIFMGKVQHARGKLRQAATDCHQIIQQGGQAPIVALAHYDLSLLQYEWNDLQAAAEQSRQGIELSRRGASPEFLARGHATLALFQQAQGQCSAARASLQEAGRQMERPDLTPGTRLHYLTQQILVSLAQGDLERAGAVARQAPEPSEAGSFPGYLQMALALVRLRLAQQQRAAAWERLAALYETALRAGWQSVVVQVRALQSLAAPKPDEAVSLLGEALALAEPEGYVRTFLDLGEPMRKLLAQIPSGVQGSAPAYAGALLSAFEARPEPTAPTTQPPPLPVQPLIEPLSERELEVLSLLAEGQMRSEIARELVVSVNTIKAHLKGIYGKLGVHDRRAAVERAHELGLI